MNKYGEVEYGDNYGSFFQIFDSEGVRELLSNYGRSEGELEDFKVRFLQELGADEETTPLGFLTSEQINFLSYYDKFIKLLRKTKIETVCPLFGVECGYLEIPGTENKLYVSAECGVVAVIWNVEDEELVEKFFDGI